MASVKRLFDQQYGFGKWNTYDNMVKRLCCLKEQQYTQLLPMEDMVCDTPIFACKFAQQKSYENFLALANEDGKLAIYNTRDTQQRYGIKAHNNVIFDLAWMFENMKIVTASGDHAAKLFDVSNADVREIRSFYGHTRSVKTVSFRKDDPSVFATGGRDGNIVLWDTRVDQGSIIGKADRTIFNSHSAKTTPSKARKKCFCNKLGAIGKSVTGLAFQDGNTLISCGAGDGIIKIWDLRKNYLFYKNEPAPKNKIPYAGLTTKNGFSSLIIDKDCLKLYANCLDNTIYCYNLGTCNPTPIMEYTGHQNSTFYIKSSLSRDGRYLISGSSDECAYIWNTDFPNPLVKLTGHTAEVTCVAWCEKDDLTLVTCSDDMTHKIWHVGSEDLPENWEILVKGKAEVVPISDETLSRKRVGFQVEANAKKQILACEKCENASTSRLCTTCSITDTPTTATKRKQLDEIGGENKRQRRLFEPLTTNETTIPPTTNLPNFVMDGIAPHLNFSPPKRKAQDWLTKLRIERQFRRDVFDKDVAPSSPKTPRLETTPKRCSSPQSPLLRFFKVKCDGHGCSKAANSSLISASPQSSQ